MHLDRHAGLWIFPSIILPGYFPNAHVCQHQAAGQTWILLSSSLFDRVDMTEAKKNKRIVRHSFALLCQRGCDESVL